MRKGTSPFPTKGWPVALLKGTRSLTRADHATSREHSMRMAHDEAIAGLEHDSAIRAEERSLVVGVAFDDVDTHVHRARIELHALANTEWTRATKAIRAHVGLIAQLDVEVGARS